MRLALLQLSDRHCRWPEFPNHYTRRAVGKSRGIEERGACGERERHGGDDGVARAGDVRDLPSLGWQGRLLTSAEERHPMLAPREEDTIALSALAEPACGRDRLVARPNPHVRNGFRFVMIRGCHRRPGVVWRGG